VKLELGLEALSEVGEGRDGKGNERAVSIMRVISLSR
jgi:hypothetical protein